MKDNPQAMMNVPYDRLVAHAYGQHTPPQRKPLTNKQIENLCPQFEDPMRREMWIIGFKAANNIKEKNT